MTARQTVSAAFEEAVSFAAPDYPQGVIRWQDEPACQTDDNVPDVILSSVSLVDEHPGGRKCRTVNAAGTLDTELSQLFRWTVQVQVEGYAVNSEDDFDPFQFTVLLRQGLLTEAARQAMRAGSPTVALLHVSDQIRPITRSIKGHTLPIYIFEVQFRFVQARKDPTPLYPIDSVSIGGDLRQLTTPQPNDVAIQFDVPES